ncbi:MAG TPA: DUF4258 domain-containing protein [Abditibacteriaceae bacterium]|jgi:hypothetical protein
MAHDFHISRHAKEEMARRGISLEKVELVLQNPEQVIDATNDNAAYQSLIDFGGGRYFLVRVIMDESRVPPVVVTVYRTSKIEKYWRQS